MWLYLETGPLERHLNQIKALKRGNLDIQRDTRDASTQRKSHVRPHQEGGHLKAKETRLKRNETCQHLELGLLALRTMRK